MQIRLLPCWLATSKVCNCKKMGTMMHASGRPSRIRKSSHYALIRLPGEGSPNSWQKSHKMATFADSKSYSVHLKCPMHSSQWYRLSDPSWWYRRVVQLYDLALDSRDDKKPDIICATSALEDMWNLTFRRCEVSPLLLLFLKNYCKIHPHFFQSSRWGNAASSSIWI
jgi:hypothetical protein